MRPEEAEQEEFEQEEFEQEETERGPRAGEMVVVGLAMAVTLREIHCLRGVEKGLQSTAGPREHWNRLETPVPVQSQYAMLASHRIEGEANRSNGTKRPVGHGSREVGHDERVERQGVAKQVEEGSVERRKKENMGRRKGESVRFEPEPRQPRVDSLQASINRRRGCPLPNRETAGCWAFLDMQRL